MEGRRARDYYRGYGGYKGYGGYRGSRFLRITGIVFLSIAGIAILK